MSLERGFKFKGDFFDSSIIGNMSYDELDFLISQVVEEIKDASEFIFSFGNDLKAHNEVPESVKRKLKYKDALVYFSRDLRKSLFNKKISIERAFFTVCKDRMDESEFNEYLIEANKLSIGV